MLPLIFFFGSIKHHTTIIYRTLSQKKKYIFFSSIPEDLEQIVKEKLPITE